MSVWTRPGDATAGSRGGGQGCIDLHMSLSAAMNLLSNGLASALHLSRSSASACALSQQQQQEQQRLAFSAPVPSLLRSPAVASPAATGRFQGSGAGDVEAQKKIKELTLRLEDLQRQSQAHVGAAALPIRFCFRFHAKIRMPWAAQGP